MDGCDTEHTLRYVHAGYFSRWLTTPGKEYCSTILASITPVPSQHKILEISFATLQKRVEDESYRNRDF
jgi:hypothetical protein